MGLKRTEHLGTVWAVPATHKHQHFSSTLPDTHFLRACSFQELNAGSIIDICGIPKHSQSRSNYSETSYPRSKGKRAELTFGGLWPYQGDEDWAPGPHQPARSLQQQMLSNKCPTPYCYTFAALEDCLQPPVAQGLILVSSNVPVTWAIGEITARSDCSPSDQSI